jgi:hypothetical protein
LEELRIELVKLEGERNRAKATIDKLNLEFSAIQQSPEQFEDLKTLFGQLGKNDRAYDDAMRRVTATLRDNSLRKKIRVMLPTIVGRIVFNGTKGTFVVLNRSGKTVYESLAV